MFNSQDFQQIAKKGLTIEQVEKQVQSFKNGFPFLKIKAPASVNHGILRLTEEEEESYSTLWDTYLKEEGNVIKFVPASGAASRLFKDVFSFLSASYNEPQTEHEKSFFNNIHKFAFFDKLNECCKQNTTYSIDELLVKGEYKTIVGNLLNKEGLNYGNKPKGVLLFHQEDNKIVTPIEEHLKEALLYAKHNNYAQVHFTVSPEHIELFKEITNKAIEEYRKEHGIEFKISFSEQSPSTDTIAVDAQNNPFRQDDGSLLFRPGGHGALIKNLNNLDADIVFIKNIDNVCQNKLIDDTVKYKKILGGLLVNIRKEIHDLLEKLNSEKQDIHALCLEIIEYMRTRLMIGTPDLSKFNEDELVGFIIQKLNRPIRVCGVVKNIGEPGGGPFIIDDFEGTSSLQILESSQIDMTNDEYKRMFNEGTHFNPVDLVCCITDAEGKHFDLPSFVDPSTGFISHKSKDGKELKALELPGLWNGAMSNWNTLFVEVPLSTFNPVKTINDLLREEHQV